MLSLPSLLKNLLRDFTTFLVKIFRSGMTSGDIVDAQMMVSKYLFPVVVLGSGRGQSTITRLNGSSNT